MRARVVCLPTCPWRAHPPLHPLAAALLRRLLVAELAQQGAGRLLEDLAPRAGLALLGLEVLHDHAHARRRDLDAVALADLEELRVAEGKLRGDRLEAVASDRDARRVAHDRRLDNELGVGP